MFTNASFTGGLMRVSQWWDRACSREMTASVKKTGKPRPKEVSRIVASHVKIRPGCVDVCEISYIFPTLYQGGSAPMRPELFFKCLADETRCRSLLLIEREQELCVCELMAALDLSQPKISRHLAQLRQCGILQDRRQGQWVFYRIHPELSGWMRQILTETARQNPEYLQPDLNRLAAMGDRPLRLQNCC